MREKIGLDVGPISNIHQQEITKFRIKIWAQLSTSSTILKSRNTFVYPVVCECVFGYVTPTYTGCYRETTAAAATKVFSLLYTALYTALPVSQLCLVAVSRFFLGQGGLKALTRQPADSDYHTESYGVPHEK